MVSVVRSPATRIFATLWALLAVNGTPSAFATEDYPWIWRSGSPHGGKVNGMAASPAQVLAISALDQLVSIAGTDLQFRNLKHQPATAQFSGPVVWHQGLWVAAGSSGALLSSPDGEQWTPRFTGSATTLDLASNGSEIIAVGSLEMILRSTDGLAWQQVHTGGTIPYYTVTWTGSQWMAGGGEELPDGGRILTSPDGVAWTQGAPLPGMSTVRRLASQNGEAVACCRASGLVYNAKRFWLHSASGWTPTDSYVYDDDISKIIWTGAEGWFAASARGNYSVLGGSHYRSSSGLSWYTSYQGPAMFCLEKFGPHLLSGGEAGVSRVEFSPTVGTRSIPLSRPLPFNLNCIVWTGQRFVTAGHDPLDAEGRVLVSEDGIAWREVSSHGVFGDSVVYDMVWTGQKICAVGYYDGSPIAWQSPDGLTWSVTPPDMESGPVVSVAWNGQRVAMVSAYGGVVASVTEDGVESYRGVSTIKDQLSGIAWNGSLWVVSGRDYIHTSPDLIEWTASVPGGFDSARGQRVITLGNQAIIPFIEGAAVVTGANPVAAWVNEYEHTTGLASNGQQVARTTHTLWHWIPYDSTVELFVQPGDFGTIGFSTSNIGAGRQVSQPLNDIVWGNGKFVAVGMGGVILTSSPPPAPRMSMDETSVTLQWDRFSNYDSYTVESSSDLTAWMPAGPAVIHGESLTLPQPGPRRFFRVNEK